MSITLKDLKDGQLIYEASNIKGKPFIGILKFISGKFHRILTPLHDFNPTLNLHECFLSLDELNEWVKKKYGM